MAERSWPGWPSPIGVWHGSLPILNESLTYRARLLNSSLTILCFFFCFKTTLSRHFVCFPLFENVLLFFNFLSFENSFFRNSEPSSTLKVTNADWKISLYVCVHAKIISRKFRFLNLQNSRVICPFYISHLRISQNVSWTYYFNVKRKILADFQICLSVPLIHICEANQIEKKLSRILIFLICFVFSLQNPGKSPLGFP